MDPQIPKLPGYSVSVPVSVGQLQSSDMQHVTPLCPALLSRSQVVLLVLLHSIVIDWSLNCPCSLKYVLVVLFVIACCAAVGLCFFPAAMHGEQVSWTKADIDLS
jgi:hypothetical protein